MSLKARAQKDIQKITGNLNEWADECVFTAPDTTQTTVNVIHTKHHLGIDPDLGIPINTRVASVAFSEANLTVSIRNASGEVNMDGWQASVKDSTGNTDDYFVKEWFPDEMIGMIVVILAN